MNDIDSKLIFEAYNEKVIDEGLKDVAKKAAQYGAIGAAAAGSAFGSPQAKSAPAAEPAPIKQTAKDQISKIFKYADDNLDIDEYQKVSDEFGEKIKALQKLEHQGKVDKLTLKHYYAEEDRIAKLVDSGKITEQQYEKMLMDLDKKYNMPSLDQLRQLMK